MRAVSTSLAAAAMLALAAGCGSSSGSGGSSSTGAAAATAGAGSASLKATTTPSFSPPPAGGKVQSGVVEVAYRNITISPDKLRVKVGSTIRWRNFDSVEHNVTSHSGPQSFASKNFGESGTFEVKVTHPGVIDYLCTLHPASMNGSIDVVG